jgi:hypothetical protein
MTKRTKRKVQPVTGEMPDFCNDLAGLVARYYEAGCCGGCMSERLIKSAVGMITIAGGICWPAAHQEEVKLIDALAKMVVGRTVGASSRTLQ